MLNFTSCPNCGPQQPSSYLAAPTTAVHCPAWVPAIRRLTSPYKGDAMSSYRWSGAAAWARSEEAAGTHLGAKALIIKKLSAAGSPGVQQMQQTVDACKVRHLFGLVSRSATSCLTGPRLRRRSVAAPCIATGCI